jgi:hypothetical protein
MGLENRLAAKVFASLLPWIDENHPVVFLQDEGGKNPNAIPDLGFRFLGSQAGPIRIEFKVVKAVTQGGSVKLTRKQVADWRQASAFSDKPHCWIGVNPDEARYFFWDHADIEAAIQGVHPAPGDRVVRVPPTAVSDKHFLAVFRALLQFAKQQKLCP